MFTQSIIHNVTYVLIACICLSHAQALMAIVTRLDSTTIQRQLDSRNNERVL